VKWSTVRNLIWTPPEKRWDADLFFVPMAVFFGVLVGGTRNHWIPGIGVAALVLAARELLYHWLVRCRRVPKKDAT